jgi:hypothetical protein
LPAIAEEVGAQGLPEVGCQGRSLSCRRMGREAGETSLHNPQRR